MGHAEIFFRFAVRQLKDSRACSRQSIRASRQLRFSSMAFCSMLSAVVTTLLLA